MFLSLNQVSDLQKGSQHSNGWANVQSAVKSNNVQTFRRIEFKKAKSDFSSNGSAPVEQNGVKKVAVEAPKKAVVKDTNTGLFEASKATNYVQWKQVARVGPGFFNDGNTCYLNSTLQCLVYTPALAQIMRHEAQFVLKNFRQAQDQPKAIIQYFQRFVDEVWSSPAGKSLSPRSMVSNIRRVGKQFKPFRQEDAHEYLRQLLDCMHEEILKANGVKLSDGKIAETTAISRVFGGYLCNTLTCSKCNYASKTYNHFQDVSLDITSGINSVSNALDHFTKPEFLSHGNEWKCEKCQIKVKAKKQMTFSQMPNVLVLHLKRFSYGNGKNMKPINFSPTITVTCHKDTGVKKVNYELHGVVVHHGHSTHSGHYIAFVKAPNGSWYEMNDSHVTVVSINKVLSCQAYILFYSRVIPAASAAATTVAPSTATPIAAPVSTTAAHTNGISKVDDNGDVGVVVKPKQVPPSLTSSVDKLKITAPSSSSVTPSVKKEVKPAAEAPDISLSESSSESEGEDDDSDADDSDFSEPSDLGQISGFQEAFTKRLNGESSESGKKSISEIYTIPRPFRFKGYLFSWKNRRRTNIRELAALMKKQKLSKTPSNHSDNGNDDVGTPVEKTNGEIKKIDTTTSAPAAKIASPTVPKVAKIYPSDTPVQKEVIRAPQPVVAVAEKPVPSAPVTNGHAVAAAGEQNGAPAPFKKPSNVVIFNNGVSVNGTETTKSLIGLSNRSRDTGGEGSWDSVSKELAEEAHAVAVQQRREEQKARNEKRLDAWNQKLDEGRVKKVKLGPSAYEAAFAGGTQPANQFQQVQDVRGSSREAYFEAGSAPFEKKRKQPHHSDEPIQKNGNGHFNGHRDKQNNGFNKKHKKY